MRSGRQPNNASMPSGGGTNTGGGSPAVTLDKWVASSPSVMDVVATSHDLKHPPAHALTNSSDTFYTTTGMYPQEIVLGIREDTKIAEIRITSRNIKRFSISILSTANATWQEVINKELPDTKGKVQNEAHQLSMAAKFFKFTILSGHDHFCAIYSIRIQAAGGRVLN
ncbi:heat shock protein beta-11 [Pelomyxa schiedti]|nr:heat shock protein beta-11 [Pelomyxa schiedti]